MTKEEKKHILYKECQPIAITCKIALQMFIGIAIIILLVLKLILHLTGEPDVEILVLLVNHHPLKMVGYALAISAGIELAYMLFTPGPDEAVEPLILGLSSAILLVITEKDIVSYEVALTVLVFTASIGFMFWVRKKFIPENNDSL